MADNNRNNGDYRGALCIFIILPILILTSIGYKEYSTCQEKCGDGKIGILETQCRIDQMWNPLSVFGDINVGNYRGIERCSTVCVCKILNSN